MINYATGQVPPSDIILPFYATGAIGFFVLCLLMIWSPQSMLLHYFNPHMLTLVHTAALGWGSMIIFGAAYQLLPVIAEHSLRSNGLAMISYYLLLAGIILLGWSFWTFRTGWIMITGGSLIVASSILYLINVVLTGDQPAHGRYQQYFMISSAFWLVFTTIAGLLLAINLGDPFFTKNHMDILKLHAHLGLAGWFLQLIAGVSSRLVPMFVLGRSTLDRLLIYALIFQNTALILFLGDVYFLGYSHRVMFYLLLMLTGTGCWLYFLYDNYRNRMRKKIDMQMKQTFGSFFCLGAAILTLPIVHYYQSSAATVVYGLLLFMGWITGIILGQTFKTLPFIVWNDHYKKLTGRKKVPLPKDLYEEKWLPLQFWLYIAALIVMLAGVILAHLWLVRISTYLWLGLAIVYVGNVSKILFHKTTIIE